MIDRARVAQGAAVISASTVRSLPRLSEFGIGIDVDAEYQRMLEKLCPRYTAC